MCAVSCCFSRRQIRPGATDVGCHAMRQHSTYGPLERLSMTAKIHVAKAQSCVAKAQSCGRVQAECHVGNRDSGVRPP
jgi:hypothetical protein